MTDPSSLDTGFAPASEEDWRALVTKTLRDKPFDSIRRTTVEGLAIEPLYTAAKQPAAFPARPFDAERPWDVRALTAHPVPTRANAELMADLEGGAVSAAVRIDPTGKAGVAIGSADGMARALSGVLLELAPVCLDAGFLGPQAADWLNAVAKSSPSAKLNVYLDPLSAFAETGESPGPVESHLVSAATVAARLAEPYPRAQLFLASGRVVHEAGGGEALEVAFAAASAIAYAKALVQAGLLVDEAFARITLGLSADTGYFQTIAKLRAARQVWARITIASGADPLARIEARSSGRMLTAKDPWTNMIRLTAASFGAAVGGADAVILGNFTDAIGLPTTFARRQSRNIQLVLMEEANVGRVADPTAGAGYMEAETDEISRAAWVSLQAIEAAGGLAAALSSGLLARKVEAANTARPKPRILGVNVFPPAEDNPVEVEQPKVSPAQAPPTRLPGPDSRCPPLASIRLAQAFEG